MGRRAIVVVVIVVVVGLQDAFSEFLLAPVDVRVQFVAVLPNRKLLIVVDGDVDASSADRLVLWVVELCHIRVPQGLLCCQSALRVELE